jgi:hypothetical protein
MVQRTTVPVPAIFLGRVMAQQLLLLLGLFGGIRKQFLCRVVHHLMALLIARPGAPSLPRAGAAFLPLFEELRRARNHVGRHLRVVAAAARH